MIKIDKMKKNCLNLVIVISILISGCVSQRTSTIVGCEYNKSKNQTDYFVIPYGNVSIPGEWIRKNYNSQSRQQFFKNSESVTIAISFSGYDKYEFNKDRSKKGYDFVTAFYEWDSKFFVDSYGLKRRLIVSDSINNYVLYQIFGSINEGKFDSYFLIGEKNGFVKNFSIMITDNWTEEQKINFLKSLYIKD